MKRNYAFWIFVAVVAGALSFAVYENAPNGAPAAESGKLRVAVSFYPLYYFASEIGGVKADVSSITPASAEPHDYEPTVRDIANIEDSNMLVLNGGNLEAWGGKLKEQLQGKNILIVTAGDGLTNKDLTENGQKITDPHVWLDPVLAKQEAANIEKGFERKDPSNAGYYAANAQALQDRLDGLDREYAQGLASCRLRDIVTSHAAFGYLAARYNLNQVAISGISPDQEPSSQAMAQVADLVKKEGIQAIFFESLVSPKLSQAIASETGARTMVLDPIEGIPEADRKNGANYPGVMENNLQNLRIALQCT